MLGCSRGYLQSTSLMETVGSPEAQTLADLKRQAFSDKTKSRTEPPGKPKATKS